LLGNSKKKPRGRGTRVQGPSTTRGDRKTKTRIHVATGTNTRTPQPAWERSKKKTKEKTHPL